MKKLLEYQSKAIIETVIVGVSTFISIYLVIILFAYLSYLFHDYSSVKMPKIKWGGEMAGWLAFRNGKIFSSKYPIDSVILGRNI